MARESERTTTNSTKTSAMVPQIRNKLPQHPKVTASKSVTKPNNKPNIKATKIVLSICLFLL